LLDSWFLQAREKLSLEQWARLVGEKSPGAPRQAATGQDRTIENYMAHLGLEPSFHAFIAEVRKQSRANWRPEFTAASVNDWIRKGFGMERAEVLEK